MSETKVVIRAGVPGMDSERANGEHRYPASASDFMKLLREQGFSVEYEHERAERTLVEFKAFDVWVPVLDFTLNVLANIPANIVATAIMNYFHAMRRDVKDSILHVEYSMRKENGDVVKFKADGAGSDVVEAIKAFDLDIRD
ncbi:hypothetical protein [Amycolatopsis sp. H20-H5]|uniref:hypothetical protein n=1 Tax=Amycolatopsis sp. H20-H5 TaxID=3046309 RepID=UPI002DB9C1A9|nr:hypothetical protein [Amycolatopsis sp. H20-H5]MEC3980418.1 hypothetical protein [Amycolatopsis sp. H20-H5]